MKSEKLELYVSSFYEKEIKDKMKNDVPKTIEEFVPDAVELAYNDTKRVCDGIGDHGDLRNNVKEKIIEKIKESFLRGDSKNDFEDIHNKLCEIWTNNFKGIGKIDDYGKAQKIVNMSFKYLYAYTFVKHKGEEDLKKFDACHFTLDSYTLNWLNKCKQKHDNGEKEKIKCLTSETKWSTLEWDDYACIRDYARVCINREFKDYTPLQAEFIIWKGVNLYNALKELYKSVKTFPDKDVLDNISIKYNEDGPGELIDFIEKLK